MSQLLDSPFADGQFVDSQLTNRQESSQKQVVSESSLQASEAVAALSAVQQQGLRAILEQGLPHCAQPYLAIAEQLQASQGQVLAQISHWQDDGLIKRLGLVVKHRQLGFNANAMVVWDIADSQVDKVAQLLSSCPEVSLCYRRPRRLPDWPYNLFCMIHGTDRHIVLAQISAMTEKFALADVAKDILFSFKAYKQQGARYGKKGGNQGGKKDRIEGEIKGGENG